MINRGMVDRIGRHVLVTVAALSAAACAGGGGADSGSSGSTGRVIRSSSVRGAGTSGSSGADAESTGSRDGGGTGRFADGIEICRERAGRSGAGVVAGTAGVVA